MKRIVTMGIGTLRAAVVAVALIGAATFAESALDLVGLAGPAWLGVTVSPVQACGDDNACPGDDDDYSPSGEETAKEGVDIDDDEEPEELPRDMTEG